MKTKSRFGILLIAVVLAGALFATYGCASEVVIETVAPSSEESLSFSKVDFFGTLGDEIDIDKAHTLWQEGTYFIDVRTQEEWDEVRIPGVPLIPLDELEGRLNEVPQDVPVVVQCRSGNRSRQGLAILQKAGYGNAVSMAGGIRNWEAAGYEVEMGN